MSASASSLFTNFRPFFVSRYEGREELCRESGLAGDCGSLLLVTPRPLALPPLCGCVYFPGYPRAFPAWRSQARPRVSDPQLVPNII